MRFYPILLGLQIFLAFLSPLAIAKEHQSKLLENLIRNVEKVCKAPSDIDKYWKIEVGGDSEGIVKLKLIYFEIDEQIELTKKEWETVQKVLREQQAADNESYKECAKKIAPPLMQKLLNKFASSPFAARAVLNSNGSLPKTGSYGQFCCDTRGNRRCSATISVPLGTECICSDQPGVGIICAQNTNEVQGKPQSYDGSQEDWDIKNPLAGLPTIEELHLEDKVAGKSEYHNDIKSSRNEISESIENAIKSMSFSNIAFNTPSSMEVDKQYTINLILDLNLTIEDLKESIQSDKSLTGDVAGERIKVSNLVQAHLHGDSDIWSITNVSDDIQPVTRLSSTNWKWNIRAKQTGHQRLILTLSAVFTIDGKDRLWTIKTFEKEILVNVGFFARADAFIKANWTWLWTAIVVPLAGLAWRKRRKLLSAFPRKK